ncbi:hypothetical protein HMPREF0262_01519 [Clostridium sp. ATCC 29733]|nr:hypothetical protein HMPREF0262_01519 [Clostridium sp. ATCC 29733]
MTAFLHRAGKGETVASRETRADGSGLFCCAFIAQSPQSRRGGDLLWQNPPGRKGAGSEKRGLGGWMT